jgi:hypothetical protein
MTVPISAMCLLVQNQQRIAGSRVSVEIKRASDALNSARVESNGLF